MTPEIVSAEQAQADDLTALFHRLHTLGVELATTSPYVEDVVSMMLDLLTGVATIMPALNRVAPDVLVILSKLDEVRDVPMLICELTEAHRLLGHGLRGHGIDPGLPPMPVGELLRRSSLVDSGDGSSPLPITGRPAQAG